LTLEFLEARSRVDQVNVTEQLAATAVSLDAKIVKSFLSLSFLGFLLVLVPQVTNGFSAGETAYRNYHRSGEP
jgi:hypothetical protein